MSALTTSAHPSGIIGSNDIVIIKGSFQWDFRNTTSTDRIKGLIWQILQHPDGFTGEILVGDNTQWATIGEDDNNSEDTEQCILDVINTFHSKGYPVHLFRWADIMYNVVTEYSDGDYSDGYTYEPISKITYPKFQSPAGNYISLKYVIWNETTQNYNHDRLCIVDFPVLKAHGWTGATLAIKNWVGVLTVAYQDERFGGNGPMHFDYFFSPYALVAKVMQVTYPKLTIIDAAWTNPEGNYGNLAIQLNLLLGSTHPFAASYHGRARRGRCRHVGWILAVVRGNNPASTIIALPVAARSKVMTRRVPEPMFLVLMSMSAFRWPLIRRSYSGPAIRCAPVRRRWSWATASEQAQVSAGRLADAAAAEPAAAEPIAVEVVQRSPQCVKFVLPPQLPDGVFAYRITAAGGTVTGLLNRPPAWWVQGDGGPSARPGGWVRWFGKNLDNAGAGLTPSLRLRGEKGWEVEAVADA